MWDNHCQLDIWQCNYVLKVKKKKERELRQKVTQLTNEL